MDPITIAKLWLMVKPIRRIRAIRNRRRARKGKPLIEDSQEDFDMLNGKKTYIGIAIAVVGFVMNWLGIGDENTATELVTHGAELFGLLVATYGRLVAKPA